ncbi:MULTISPECIES: hypothetical protein [unclassified Rhizobium]|uniref:hypothetical protein n=1 Tax=unclassified Rhizobium TaxID=2613769 RepID=UPI001FED703B|nr:MULTISPECIES: hypothetical protein [unclassified Rhizobium]
MRRDKQRQGQLQRVLEALSQNAPAGSQGEAWNAIFNAVQQVQAVDRYGTSWTIPALDAPSSRPYGNGGTALRLIGHHVYLNANGAYRIIDLSSGEPVHLFDKENAAGMRFAEVPGYRMQL